MRPPALDALACPACRVPLRLQGSAPERGLLLCPRCGVGTPVLGGSPLFHEETAGVPEDLEAYLAALEARALGDAAEHERFLRAKRRRPVFDAYAAFSPWNEAQRAIVPLLPLLREGLRPGDLILDLWCRTGWSGEWLAGLFPEQTVLAVWEGPKDVLGPRGFRRWLAPHWRRPNLEVLFTDPNDPLPFADGAFALVHGHDALHRYRLRPFLGECLRVARAGAPLVFPHVHLSNSEPEPFFERGERQLHGREYRRWLDQVLAGTEREGFVLSELGLFAAEREGRFVLRDDAETAHYNACVLVAPAAAEGRTLVAETLAAEPGPGALAPVDAVAVLNPLVDLDLSSGTARVNRGGLAGRVDELLLRHPVQEQRLAEALPERLELADRLVLYWALRLFPPDEVARRTGLPTSEVRARLAGLERAEVIRAASVSPAMGQLQTYYRCQRYQPRPDEPTLPWLWSRALLGGAERPFLVWAPDGSVFSYADADEIARRIARLVRERVEPGERVLLPGAPHPEVVLAFWGVTLAGAVPAVIDPELGGEALDHALRLVAPRLAFALPGSPLAALASQDPPHAPRLACPCLGLGVEADAPGLPALFPAALAGEPLGPDALARPEPDAPALVLFTSGSSGPPKGVVLAHRGLVASADLLDRTWGLRGDDRLFLAGRLHTMSGLRNACLTPLWSGGSLLLAPLEGQGPLAIMEAALAHGATVLNTTPAFLSAWLRMPEKVRYFAAHRLRLLLCTGAALAPALREGFEALLRVAVCDYYGLTETCRLCAAVGPHPPGAPLPAGIGHPVGAIALVVDEAGRELPPGAEGELVVHSEGLFLGYLEPEGRIDPRGRIRAGFFHTGDLARRTPEGALELLGRRDRLLIDRHGENLAPEEVERALEALPGVLAAHAVPWTGPDLVPGLAALVVLRDAPVPEALEEVRRAAAKVLPPARVPNTWLALERVPTGPAGKWDPRLVQELLAGGGAATRAGAPARS